MKRLAWDNANIIESYPGVCTPLTFSFARASYREVYMQLMDAFHVDRCLRPELRRRYEVFLGYVGGRFYYNLETWCVLVSYLPGTSRNPAMLQEMMGVKPGDQLDISLPTLPPLYALKGSLLALRYHVQLPHISKTWIDSFDRDFPTFVHRVDQANELQRLMELYFDIETRFLFQWTAPILNDIAVMIYTGSLRRMSRQRGQHDIDPSLLIDIGSGGNVRMIQLLRSLAAAVEKNEQLRKMVEHGDQKEAWQQLLDDATTGPLCRQLMDDFGMRNGNDLKLETPNFRERPGDFIPVIRQYLDHTTARPAMAVVVQPSGFLYRWLLRQARGSINQREEMRLKRSKVFGLVRQVFMRVGELMAMEKVIERSDDIFYLEVEECWQLIRGTSTIIDVRPLIAQRRREYDQAQQTPMSSHVVTDGIPQRFHNAVEAAPTGVLVGRPNYPANIEAEVIVMTEPSFTTDVRGKILVCPQTDPSWTPILGLVAGLIVERGGILSHAAIFSRELRIPSILGVDGACTTLHTGQRIRLEGVTGKIVIL